MSESCLKMAWRGEMKTRRGFWVGGRKQVDTMNNFESFASKKSKIE